MDRMWISGGLKVLIVDKSVYKSVDKFMLPKITILSVCGKVEKRCFIMRFNQRKK